MNPLLDVALRSSLVLGAGLLLVELLRRQSATVRHAVLLAAMAAAALVPLVGIALPSLVPTVPMPQWRRAAEPRVIISIDAAVPRDPERVDAHAGPAGTAAVPVVWLAGALVGLGLLARASSRVRAAAAAGRLIDKAHVQELLRDLWPAVPRPRLIEVGDHERVPTPATWGLRHPAILLPPAARTWDAARLRLVLTHEAAHITRADWALQLVAESLRAIYWWHPLFWLAAARVRRESELACDEFVIATSGVAPAEYAAHLVALARAGAGAHLGWSGAVPMAQSSLLERRVRIMLSSRHGRHALSPRKALALATVVGVLALTMGSVRAAQDQGDLRGVVYDSTGAVVPEVEVTLSLSDEEKLVVYTSRDGSFSYPNVPAGTYTLSARLAGFAALTEEITLAAASDWNRAITLELGTVQETIRIVAERTAPAVAPATAEPPRLRVGGNIRAPRKLKDVKPVYPPAMLADGREGDVTLEAIIDGEGTVRSVRVLGALVHPDFALAAADAVKQWVFSPTLLNGAPVEVVMTVSMSFRLSE